jgi:hypothetical protein
MIWPLDLRRNFYIRHWRPWLTLWGTLMERGLALFPPQQFHLAALLVSYYWYREKYGLEWVLNGVALYLIWWKSLDSYKSNCEDTENMHGHGGTAKISTINKPIIPIRIFKFSSSIAYSVFLKKRRTSLGRLTIKKVLLDVNSAYSRSLLLHDIANGDSTFPPPPRSF